jgi:hypothetical protein
MSQAEGPGLEALRAAAERLGIRLDEAEAAAIAANVQRNLDMAQRLRALVQPGSEPQPVFEARQRRGGPGDA